MIAAAYIRVSTEDQANEGYSIGAQINEIKKYCEKNDIELGETYCDEGLSGTKEDRPQFQKMLSDAEKGMFGIILVHKFDRFARKIELSHKIKAQLKKSNVNVISITEPIEDSPIGFFQEGLLELLAEYYVKNLSKEVKKGMLQRARQGLPLGFMPFGYNTVGNVITVNEEQAEVVRKIFELYINGRGYVSIARYLNDHGHLLMPKAKIWRYSAVESVLNQKKYAAIFEYNGEEHPAQWEPIVSREIFHKAQSLRGIKGQRYNYRGNNFEKFAMLGLMQCVCGGAMCLQSNTSGKRLSSRHTYMCNLAKRSLLICKNNKMHHADKFESAIIEALEAVANGSITEFEIEEIKTSERTIASRRTNIKSELERAKQAYLAGVFMLNEYGTIKARLEKELEELKEDKKPDRRQEVVKNVQSVVERLKTAETPNDRRVLLSEIISRIIVSREQTKIIFKV